MEKYWHGEKITYIYKDIYKVNLQNYIGLFS